MAKRDLAKIGVTSLEQLDSPLPQGIRCKIVVALRKDDDGTERNRVVRFEVLGIDEPVKDAFAPEAPPVQPAHEPDGEEATGKGKKARKASSDSSGPYGGERF